MKREIVRTTAELSSLLTFKCGKAQSVVFKRPSTTPEEQEYLGLIPEQEIHAGTAYLRVFNGNDVIVEWR